MTIGELSINEVIGLVASLAVAIVSFEKLIGWTTTKFNKLRKKVNKEELLEQTVNKHECSIKEIRNFQKNIGDGIKEVLRVFLIQFHKEYIEQGFIYVDQLTYYNEMFSTYTNLGGNYTITHLHDEILKLETKTR